MTRFNRRIVGSVVSIAIATSLSSQAMASGDPVNFTGPLLTPNPMTLPAGTLLAEPYLMYYSSGDAYNNQGQRYTKVTSIRQWQTLVPVYYGVTDRLQLQISGGGAHSMSGGSHTTGFGATDTTVGAQYLLLAPAKDGNGPALSVNYQHRFPTGAYDQLDENPLNATGDGASVDTFSFRAQQYVWLSNGRPLRFRAVVSYSLPPDNVRVNGVSVYGTPQDFHGQERLGGALGISTSVEYSIDSHWVLATDLTYNRTSPGQLTGVVGTGSNALVFARRDAVQSVYSLAPAIEYNFNDRFGLIGGVQFSFAGRNNDAFVTPMTAFNMVF
jgi:hypothetical protein